MSSLGGTKIIGRYLKKGSATIDKVKITPFKFDSLTDAAVIYSDNAKRNIIHADLHEPSELAEAVVSPKEMNTELVDPSLKPQIFFPRNFTKDWAEDRRKQKKRGQTNFDEDEEIDQNGDQGDRHNQEFAEQAESDSVSANETTYHSEPSSLTDKLEREMKASASSDFTPGLGDHRNPTGQTPAPHGKSDFDALANLQNPGRMSIDASMALVGNAIKEMALSDQKQPQTEKHAFIPVDLQGLQNGEQLEDSALEEYGRQRLRAEIDVEAIKNEAQAQGYEAGFRVGEERATLQYREKINSLFENVNSLIEELSGLKRDILEQVQENFFEISQAMCEALIERAIHLDPTVFSGILHRAISEAVEGDAIKIRVSPKMADLLLKIESNGKADNIVADNSLRDDEFKIDSNLGVVDASIRNIIKDLLEKADLDLFDSSKKAG